MSRGPPFVPAFFDIDVCFGEIMRMLLIDMWEQEKMAELVREL